jgi:cell division protein FtsB
MKVLAGVLSALIVAIQYPLWLGKGGWLRVWDVDRQLAAQAARNERLALRNGALAADVKDLKQGTDAIEERARYELGMVKGDEVFFQLPARP